MKEHPFKRTEHIKKSSDFSAVFKHGRKAAAQGASLFVLPNGGGNNRIGFALPRGYGNAVKRNRSKRISREAYRLMKGRLKTGYDMVLLVRPGQDSFKQRCRQLNFLFRRAGIVYEAAK